MSTLQELVEQLPPDLQQEVRDFVGYLLEKRRKRPKSKPDFSWAGALQDYRDQYTSLELE